MFTGIVQNKAPIRIERTLNLLKTVSIELSENQSVGLKVGASIALNGVCLTVTQIIDGRAYFDVMMETLACTNLGGLSSGALVNVERAARLGDDIGGHLMSGHIATMVEVLDVATPENNCVLWFALLPEQRKYLFSKGYVGLNGCSLTIGQVLDDRFNVFLIPETLAVTTFDTAKVGDLINLEYDAQTQAVVDTVERMQAGTIN